MGIIKKRKIFCIDLKIITLFFVFSVFIFNSCNLFKHIPKENDNSIVIEWNDNENREENKKPRNNLKTNDTIDSNKKSSLSGINPDSIAGSGTDVFEEFSQIFGYSLSGDENPNLLSEIAIWLGTRYKYGGSTLEGVDCSGFVGNIYFKVFKIRLSRSSKDIVNDVILIPKEELENGDILFFKINGKNISHVGIYISNNKFVHASNKRGVVINDLEENYYKERFYTGGRVKK